MNLNERKIKYYLNNVLTIPSPTGYTSKIMDYIKEELHIISAYYYTTNKGAIIVSIKGKDDENQRTLSAHVDTLGAMVKGINSNGTLALTPLGGYMMNSIEGENCTVETIEGKVFTGTIQTKKPSVHISGNDARELKRTPENMEVVLDEKVFSKEDVEKLEINVGDFICLDSRTSFTEKGFIKTRHLDDKASVAILLYVIKYILENSLDLPYTTNILISNYEEVGHGACYIPPKTKEFISVDMGAPGLDQNSSEYCVCICAKDSSGPYDLDIRKKLTDICKKNNINYKIDTYPHYGSDASAALRAGYDIKTGLIGPGIFASHAYERTHMDSVLATTELVLNYCKSN
ncbi:M42 family metallopeptidase [Haloimpatiens massiliensis]|uniref:M42 family metallopeptidase n=1 Tax=Haloimpatiens massiliensis TaxID=1658110 RepID=UPI000C814C1C|nr:M42 family metallopeptidase [Haloimpatiens massiliensis]